MSIRTIQAAFAMLMAAAGLAGAQSITVSWDHVERVSNTTATLQVVVNPPLRRGSAIHDRVFAELQKLGADYVRYVPWLPYPRLGVAELEPPSDSKTSWDFSLIDPMTIDFLNATKGHPVVLNFSTIPAWMFRTPKPVEYPRDPDEAVWDYTQGTELRDPSGKELGEYYARLVGWYVNGGFTDELGKRHESGHRFPIDYWEVLNEPDLEHHTTPEQYTARYDAIVAAIRKVAPRMKFVGVSVAYPSGDARMFEYFLNPKNHKPGIPLDMISYHFYAISDRRSNSGNPAVHVFRPGRPLPRDRALHRGDPQAVLVRPRERRSTKSARSCPAIRKAANRFRTPTGTSPALATRTCSVTWPSSESTSRANRSSWAIRRSSRAYRWSTGTRAHPMRGSASCSC